DSEADSQANPHPSPAHQGSPPQLKLRGSEIAPGTPRLARQRRSMAAKPQPPRADVAPEFARCFAEPLRLAALVADFSCPWYLCGGWAIDLFLGRVTREHHDLDLILFRDDQEALRRYLPDWEFIKFLWGPGGELDMEWWEEGEWLAPPVVELYVQ